MHLGNGDMENTKLELLFRGLECAIHQLNKIAKRERSEIEEGIFYRFVHSANPIHNLATLPADRFSASPGACFDRAADFKERSARRSLIL